MAIYHFSVKNIGRSNGQSAVACAAYRSAERLTDETYGKEQDYTKKTGVVYKKIYAPVHTNPELVLDRSTLWNAVEKSECKKNGDLKQSARLAKEFEVAFPCEVNADTRQKMLDELANTLVKRHDVVVDAVIHAPHTEGGSDGRNYHAHIMFTTRSINEQGNLGKKAREFNDDGKKLTLEYRELWANLVNHELEKLGLDERVSHLSYKDLKYNLEPTIHEGSTVTKLRRMGVDTEISLKNDAIKQRNTDKSSLAELEREILLSEQQARKYQSELQAKQVQLRIRQDMQQRKDDPRAELDRLQHSYDQIKRNISNLEEQITQLEANEPPVKKFFNKKHDEWSQRLHMLKSEKYHNEQQHDIFFNKIYSHPVYTAEKAEILQKCRQQTKAKPLTFEQVYEKLDEQRKVAIEAYKLLILEHISSAPQKKKDEKISEVEARIVEMYQKNPNFKLESPKIPVSAEQTFVCASSKKRGMER